jgi:tRNA dimethylallyltransferase
MKSQKPIPKILLISGPTGSGKTKLALKLAAKFDGELISADSRQVYIGLDFGTNKFGKSLKKWRYDKENKVWFYQDIPVYLFDQASPNLEFSVYDFVKLSRVYIKKIWQKDKLPIIVGGTGFYQHALIYPFESLGISANYKLRSRLEKLSTEELLNVLETKDYERFKKIDRENRQRIIRAIEISESSEKPKSINKLNFDYLWIGLTADRQIFYQKADIWVEDNLSKIVLETKKMIKSGYKNTKPLSGLIYKNTILHIYKKISKAKLAEILKFELHDYIRRQFTWFKKEKDIIWLNIKRPDFENQLENEIKKWYS